MKKFKLTQKDIIKAQKELEKTLKEQRQVSKPAITINIPLTLSEHPKATLSFKMKAYTKMLALVDTCEKEIAWHGLVTKRKKNNKTTYTVEDILMFPQIVTAATVKGKEPDYAMWCAGLPDDQLNKMRMHGHSHVRMGVNPSGIDTSYQDDMVETIEDFYIFLIINKRREIWTRIVDVTDNIVYDEKDVDVVVDELASNSEWVKKAIEEYLTESAPVTVSPVTTAVPVTRYGDFQQHATTYQQMVLDQIDRRKAEEKAEKESKETSWQNYLKNSGYGRYDEM